MFKKTFLISISVFLLACNEKDNITNSYFFPVFEECLPDFKEQMETGKFIKKYELKKLDHNYEFLNGLYGFANVVSEIEGSNTVARGHANQIGFDCYGKFWVEFDVKKGFSIELERYLLNLTTKKIKYRLAVFGNKIRVFTKGK